MKKVVGKLVWYDIFPVIKDNACIPCNKKKLLLVKAVSRGLIETFLSVIFSKKIFTVCVSNLRQKVFCYIY